VRFERDTVEAIQQRAFRDFFEMMARSSNEAKVVELDGVAALTVPAVPRRSIPNSVVYRDFEPASCLATIDHEPVAGAKAPDCGIYWVATPEEYRGRGLSTRLLCAALMEARERGCATTSLQASQMGEPIYTKLGYQMPYRYYLYERRASA